MSRKTIFHRIFHPVKTFLPSWISNPIRSFFTAILTPTMFSYQTGHFKSSFKMAAVSKNGKPLPWYTYPCIDFLSRRSFTHKIVLELGGGYSTFWWSERAKHVVTFESDKEWYQKIKNNISANTDLLFVPEDDPRACVAQVKSIVYSKYNFLFDVIIIDGLPRREMIPIALKVMKDDGVIICDNAEGYGFYEGFKESGLMRVDFWGYAPGVILPHCTSVFFKPNSFLFASKHSILGLGNIF